MSAWRARMAERKNRTRGKGGSSMEAFVQDIRYAIRGLARSPGFTALAVLSLAIGVGANTSMFSVANGMLWQQLPVPEADRAAAIAQAITGARAGDCILVAGKGHEAYQQVGENRLPFDDVQQARLALAQRANP